MSATSPKVTCDGCGDDITATGNSVDYRLVLESELLPQWWQIRGESGGSCTDMMIYPPIKGRRHFCGLKCLDVWVANKHASVQEKE